MSKTEPKAGRPRMEQPKTFFRFKFGEDQEMIALNIKKAREEMRISGRELSRRCSTRQGSKEGYIYEIEGGKSTVSANNLLIIARATNKPIEFFYTKHDE